MVQEKLLYEKYFKKINTKFEHKITLDPQTVHNKTNFFQKYKKSFKQNNIKVIKKTTEKVHN